MAVSHVQYHFEKEVEQSKQLSQTTGLAVITL